MAKDPLEELMQILKGRGCSHIRVIGCQHLDRGLYRLALDMLVTVKPRSDEVSLPAKPIRG